MSDPALAPARRLLRRLTADVIRAARAAKRQGAKPGSTVEAELTVDDAVLYLATSGLAADVGVEASDLLPELPIGVEVGVDRKRETTKEGRATVRARFRVVLVL